MATQVQASRRAHSRERGGNGKAAGVRGRRVRRILRSVDTWSVLKFSLLLYLSLFVVLLVASIGLWLLASWAGVIGNVETFIGELLAEEDPNFHFIGPQILGGAAFGGLILVVLGTGVNVLLSILYNLIADAIGGVEITVLEEETRRGVV